ncbi:MAG: acyl-CoA thioesterase [Desulfamplus sp.]|nr:acyl-CoA thioesterase [Desulfamplus sp.]
MDKAQLQPKCVKDTMVTLARVMQPSDANPGGIVHGGSVMKEIDNAAGVVAIKHAGNLAVTASIDRIDFHNMIFIGEMITIKASINMAGRTSMEIGVRVDAEDLLKGTVRRVASAYLTFVAVDKTTGRPLEVPGLILETDEEKRRNKEALKRKELRMALKKFETSCKMDPTACINLGVGENLQSS